MLVIFIVIHSYTVIVSRHLEHSILISRVAFVISRFGKLPLFQLFYLQFSVVSLLMSDFPPESSSSREGQFPGGPVSSSDRYPLRFHETGHDP